MTRLSFGILVVLISVSPAFAQTQVRLKLADGSYMTVDDAWESPQGVWYRRGGLNNVLPKDRVKKIERIEAQAETPAAKPSDNDDDHFDAVEMVAAAPPTNKGVYDGPTWIHLKGGARVEADSAAEEPAGVWYKRGGMSIFIDRSRIDRIELEDAAVASSPKKGRGWSTGRSGLDSLILQNGSKYNVDPYLIFLVMEQESHFNTHAVSPKGARGLMQLMPGTAARFGVRRPHDAAQNISGGTRYLRELLNRFNNRVDLVLASYNAGEGAVAKFGHRVPPYRETRNYVKKISYRYKRTTARTKRPAAE
jgi:Zn-finger nucleic acid-binding protein